MSLFELIRRDPDEGYNRDEMHYLVEQYLFKCKGQNIKIVLAKGTNPYSSSYELVMQREVELLKSAAQIALDWLKTNR